MRHQKGRFSDGSAQNFVELFDNREPFCEKKKYDHNSTIKQNRKEKKGKKKPKIKQKMSLKKKKRKYLQVQRVPFQTKREGLLLNQDS